MLCVSNTIHQSRTALFAYLCLAGSSGWVDCLFTKREMALSDFPKDIVTRYRRDKPRFYKLLTTSPSLYQMNKRQLLSRIE